MIPPEVEEYILLQKMEFQPLLSRIAEFISTDFSELEVRMSYQLPFYYLRKRVLYLSVISNDRVRLGFCKGAELAKDSVPFTGYSDEVSYLDYQNRDRLDFELIRQNILLAIELDQRSSPGLI